MCVKTVADPLIPERLTGRAAGTFTMGCVTDAAGVKTRAVLVTCDSPHWLTSGDVLVVENAVPTGYNGTYTIKVLSATTFTFQASSVPMVDASVAATYYAKLPVADATVMGLKAPQTDNVGAVFLGLDSTDGMQPFRVLPGGEVYLTPPEKESWDLSDWWLDVAEAGDGVVILYNK